MIKPTTTAFILALLCGCGGGSHQLPTGAYRVIILDPGSGAIGSPGYSVAGMNASGIAVGCVSPSQHPIRYDHGATTDLGLLPGADWTSAQAINGTGQIAGYGRFFSPQDVTHACTWLNGSLIDIQPPWSTYSWASSINDSGQIVGWADRQGVEYAVIWNGLQPATLPSGSQSGGSLAYGINNAGQIVGASSFGRVFPHACTWQNGAITDLDPDNTMWDSYALSINDSGQIAGYRTVGGFEHYSHATLWQNGTMVDLGVQPGVSPPASFAQSINNKGQIVGYSGATGGSTRAFLYQNGTMTDLTSLIPANLGYIIINAMAINDKGEILAGAWRPSDGTGHAVLLVPR